MKFLIQSPHTKQECLRELDEVSAKGQKALAQFFWGCASGDHTGYAIVEARDTGEAKALVPEFLRAKARIVELKQFTQDEIRSLHKAA